MPTQDVSRRREPYPDFYRAYRTRGRTPIAAFGCKSALVPATNRDKEARLIKGAADATGMPPGSAKERNKVLVSRIFCGFSFSALFASGARNQSAADSC
jgi:hypothetical protein